MATRFPGDVRLTLWIVAIVGAGYLLYSAGRLIWAAVGMAF